MLTVRISILQQLMIALAVLVVAGSCPSQARSFRVSMIPNGAAFSCLNCHNSPSGGSRNAFGQDVEALVAPNAPTPFWTAELAIVDSDGDGFANGVELGDPDGDGTPVLGAGVTNPGNRNSKPANQPPVFTSDPVTLATIGASYVYQAAASDLEGHTLTFSKGSDPAWPTWLSLSPAGLLSGTPPEGAAGDQTITVEVTDAGSPRQSAAPQVFTLTVVAAYSGWRNLHFDLPGEEALAVEAADPDNDGLPNFVEYGFRLDPRVSDELPRSLPVFDVQGRMILQLEVRNDDPRLQVSLAVASDALLGQALQLQPSGEDPDIGGGFKRVTFTDVLTREEAAMRFSRPLLEQLP